MIFKSVFTSIIITFCFCITTTGQGLEIYLVKHSYPDFTKNYSPDHCFYCLEPNISDLWDSALIKESDIVNFDWENQTIYLRHKKMRELNKIQIPLEGLAVAITIDKEPIYGFWLWNTVSSFGCDRVFVYPDFGFKIEFGLPKGNTKGTDPRYDIRIKNYLIKSKLIK